MNSKNAKIWQTVGPSRTDGLDPRYAGFFDCFNRQEFFLAHEVLENLWLLDRHGSLGAFYKGLIQLAGAFVHVQKNRPGPAIALFRLARANLATYPPQHEKLNLTAVLHLIDAWITKISQATPIDSWPTLHLESN